MYEKNEFNQNVDFLVSEWSIKQRPEQTKIITNMIGKHCIVEPLSIDKHAQTLFDVLQKDNLGESWTYLPYGPFATCDDFCKWLQKTTSEADTVLYAIIDVKTNLPIGVSGYLRINPEHGVIEVGHLHFSSLLKRTPAATEAMYLMMRYAFDDLGYRRYEWKCNALNDASRAAALRFGFTFEGIFRQSNVFKDHNRDTAWFSILDKEWPELKARFQRWLSDDNFDGNGHQIKSLQSV